MNKEFLLKLDDVSASYGSLCVLHGVSLEVDEGEIVALMGPNGAGKSTVLKAVFGLVHAEQGEIIFRGKPITPVPHEVARMGLAFVPQGRRVFPRLTVEENLEIGGVTVGDAKEIRRRIEDLVGLFPALKAKRKEKSGNLSGGQQQMLAIARGLMTDPKLLLLDEPTLGLAPKIVKEVFERIKEINARHRTAIMVVEHNLKSLLEIADRAYVLDKGAVCKKGTAKEVVESGILEKIFLGHS